MDRDEGDVAAVPLSDPPVYLIDGHGEVDGTDVDAKNVKPRDLAAYRYDCLISPPDIRS
jgi:hypothetical protein